MVGDTLKKASDSSGVKLIEVKDFGDTQYALFTLLYIESTSFNVLKVLRVASRLFSLKR